MSGLYQRRLRGAVGGISGRSARDRAASGRIVLDGVEHPVAGDAPRLFAPPSRGCHPARAAAHRKPAGLYRSLAGVGDQLFLNNVQGWIDEQVTVGSEAVLPGLQLPCLASRVHGMLRGRIGGIVRYVHAEFENR